MQYLTGTTADLLQIRAAIDQLAGMPKPDEGLEHVFGPPRDIGGGQGLFAADSSLYLPYAGQSAMVDNVLVQVPAAAELIEGADLPGVYLDFLWAQLYPAEFYPNGAPPRPEDWAP